VLEDRRVRRGAAVVCLSWPGKLGRSDSSWEGYLDIVRVELNGLVRVYDGVSVRFKLDVCLRSGVSRRQCAAGRGPPTWARFV
jgi:hypothetical protein